MNQKTKKSIGTAAAILLAESMALFSGMSVFAATDAEYTKKENVYVIMDSEGKVTGTYVVNNFHVTKEGEITDYGDYDCVQNLTNLDEIENDGEEHTFWSEKGKFYYQGDISDKELPWLIEIRYQLDGDKKKPEEMAGVKGDLEMTIHVEPNTQADNRIFSASYLLQVSVTLDSGICENIRADGATIVDAGENEQVTFTVMPGTTADLVIEAEVENFEMDRISISGASAAGMGTGSRNGTASADEGTAGTNENAENGAAQDGNETQEAETLSFVSEDNKDTSQVIFLMTVDGITIPEEEAAEEVVVQKTFVQKLKELLSRILD